MKKIIALILALVMVMAMTACSGGGAAASTDFSKKNVTCIVPYDAGGGTDAVMRGLADAAKGSFKSITVENRSGAGGATGMLYGANAKNDGSIVTMITVELATLEAMGNNAGLTYSQFKPIMMVNSAASAIPLRLMTIASTPWKTSSSTPSPTKFRLVTPVSAQSGTSQLLVLLSRLAPISSM